MGDAYDDILPVSVEPMLEKICREKGLQQPDFHVRKALGSVGENAALKLLKDISKSHSIRTLNGYIMFMIKTVKESSPMSSAETVTIRSVPCSSVNSSPTNGETTCSSQVCRGQTLSASTNVRQISPLIGDQSSSLPNHKSDNIVGVNSRSSYSNSRGVTQRSHLSGDHSSSLSNHQSDDVVRANSHTSYSSSRCVIQRSPLFGDHSSPLSSHQSDDIVGVNSRSSYPNSSGVMQRSPLSGNQYSLMSNHQSDNIIGVNSGTSYSQSGGVMQRSPLSGDQSSPLSNHQSDDIIGVTSGMSTMQRSPLFGDQSSPPSNHQCDDIGVNSRTSYSKSRGVVQRSPLSGDQSSPLSIHQSDDIIGVTSRTSYSEIRGATQRSPLFWDQSTPLSNHRCEDKVAEISRTRYSDSREKERSEGANKKLVDLSQLEFRRFFMLLTYTGNEKLEDVLTTDEVDDILSYKDSPMGAFESHIWNVYGQRFSDNTSRVQYADWNLGKTHLYHCHLYPDGSRLFKGPYLNAAGTHLQREVGDDNVLIVKMLQEGTYCSKSIADEGIFIGLRQYRFFVYKDAARGTKLKSKDKNESFISCYFVHMESLGLGHKGQTYTLSGKTVHDARCLFMHVHMVSTMAKYMPRFSLILSKTVTLPINLASVDIQIIEDIPCVDKNGRAVCDDDNEPLILTDGTGFISKDLAAKCPKDFYKSKYLKDTYSYEKSLNLLNDSLSSIDLGGKEPEDLEYPLLMQCRIFYNGCAVKGTLLVDLMLPASTIQIRPSMIKVKTDSRLSSLETFNSLEMVAISHKPKRAHLSKNLIVLLSYGNVPREYFLGLLRNALDSLKNIYTDEYTALKVADIYSERDDVSLARSMILADIPLHEPHLQHCLSVMAKEERNGLKEGKLPIDDSYYLMGTVDPTGTLNPDEVSVILGDGQISGKVLVYRNPGLHYGDIHVLTAVYVSALEEMVGNAKYAIFFPAKGQRSVASEIANGDYDGDMYFVSRNPQLLEYFRPSKPWKRLTATLKTPQRKPHEVLKELEHVLFQEFLEARCPSYAMATAADSWLAFMDKLLSLGDDNSEEKRRLNQKILKLIDLYYDAVDAPKSGNKVVIPDELKAREYPHYMGKVKFSYQSDSVLGEIYDSAVRFIQNGQQPNIEIQKLPCFDAELHEHYLNLWRTRYNKYRFDMKKALSSTDREVNNASAAAVIRKYKEMLYDADELHNSIKNLKEIYDEALAIYHVTYDHAKSQGEVSKCGFAWKVAGPVLCSLYIRKQGETPLACSPAALRKIL